MVKKVEVTSSSSSMVWAALLRFAAAAVVLPAIFVIPAGTLDYWQAWAYCAVVLASAAGVVIYFLKKDPEFLRRRLEMKERRAAQKKVINWGIPLYLLLFILPGLDKRFGWSSVPPEISLLALATVLLGYFAVFLTFKENTYAARTIRVEKHQTTISTGPYATVRHPMYTGVLLMMLATPIALGSYWATILFFPIAYLIAVRALDEEKMLRKELKGYEEYCGKVGWRIVPGIW